MCANVSSSFIISTYKHIQRGTVRLNDVGAVRHQVGANVRQTIAALHLFVGFEQR